MIAYRAALDVSWELAWFVSQLLVAERRRRGTPRGNRALTCFWQAVLGLRWFRNRTAPDALARAGRARRCHLKDLASLFTDYRRPLKTFKSSFRAAIGLYFFKESFA